MPHKNMPNIIRFSRFRPAVMHSTGSVQHETFVESNIRVMRATANVERTVRNQSPREMHVRTVPVPLVQHFIFQTVREG